MAIKIFGIFLFLFLVIFLPVFPCMGCGFGTFANFYTVFFTNKCKCCAPNLQFHDFGCWNGSLKIYFLHYHFCESMLVTSIRVKLGIKSGNLTISEIYNSIDIGTWDRAYLKSYESAPASWIMHKWFFEQIKTEKKPVYFQFGSTYTYWGATSINISKMCS